MDTSKNTKPSVDELLHAVEHGEGIDRRDPAKALGHLLQFRRYTRHVTVEA